MGAVGTPPQPLPKKENAALDRSRAALNFFYGGQRAAYSATYLPIVGSL